MKIVITAGGTTEKIDEVRTITNSATGALGVEIAKQLNKHEIYFLGSEAALKLLDIPVFKTIKITDVASLKNAVEMILNEQQIDAFIHSMAVSDYTVESVSSNGVILDRTKKISSDIDTMDIKLVKAPKIIDMIKKISPKTELISFKLLNNVSKDELISVAKKQMERTNSKYVIANDLTKIDDVNHEALFIASTYIERFNGKKAIAERIALAIKSIL